MNGSMIGRVFNNRYQLTERIGIGGMAEVYRAQDQVLGRIVAVKVMLPQYAADPEFTRRFRQEAAAAANLQSPYIVNVYDWGQDDGTYYIVMEFVRGTDLKTAIQTRGAINQRKVAEIGSQVCQALSVAHNQDIIHRDVKPQNIMIQPDGNVKVMDFGIARAKNSVKSQTSAVLGTAHYISPEQAQGKELTASSDIYSLGIVLYEAATGQLPFDGPDSVSVAMKQVSDFPVPPSQINPDIDPGLEAIIMRALEKNPLARFATASDMKAALTDYLAGRPVNVQPDATQMMGGYVAAGAVGAAGAAAMGAGASTSVMPPVNGAQQGRTMTATTPGGQPNKNSSEKSNKKPIIIVAIIIAVLALAIGLFFALNPGQSDTVPDVKGKSVAEATIELQKRGYVLGTTTEIFDTTVEAGKVVSTSPPAGTKLEKGAAVDLTISKGKDQVAIPDVVGKSKTEVEAALTKAGLNYREGTAEYSNDVAEGMVIRTDPAVGTKVDTGSVVTYILSKGPENVKVPDLSGMTQNEAERALNNAGLKLGKVSKQSSSKVAEGDVMNQNPSAGTSVARDTAVSITISTGKEAPDVIGESEDRAKSVLENAGFSVRVARASSSSVPKGYVIDQYTTGDTVTITVSTGPEGSAG